MKPLMTALPPQKPSLIKLLILSTAVGHAACTAQPEPLCVTGASDAHHEQQDEFRYTACTIANPPQSEQQKLSLYWWNTETKQPFYTFSALKKQLNNEGNVLRFAVNAGMYNQDFAPLALYVAQGKQYKSLNQKEGKGNFHLMPNGVFWMDATGTAHVTETNQFAQLTTSQPSNHVVYATQSGPMLVIDGKIHPKFNAKSNSRKIRNGVGICRNKENKSVVRFITSDERVNFHQFALLFKDRFQCDNALFLDGGRASALYSDDLNRHDKKYMGVMIAVTEPQPE